MGNKKFMWDTNLLKRFYEKYVVNWLYINQNWTQEQKQHGIENLGLAPILGTDRNTIYYSNADNMPNNQYNATIFGVRNKVTGYGAFAGGIDCEIGDRAASFNTENKSTGSSSFSCGYKTFASGNNSHAEGQETSATSVDSHAEGYKTLAQNECAHAEGWGTKASGLYSHAEGSSTSAEGLNSHAEGGGGTIASGEHSHADGWNTYASGNKSHNSFSTIFPCRRKHNYSFWKKFPF